jgi:hypothetical protein
MQYRVGPCPVTLTTMTKQQQWCSSKRFKVGQGSYSVVIDGIATPR